MNKKSQKDQGNNEQELVIQSLLRLIIPDFNTKSVNFEF